MELRQLYYFVAVADTLSFSRAAEALYVSQSALSKQMAGLEEELGVLLFTRGGKRSIALTREGELLLTEAKEILMRSEKLVPLLRHSVDRSAPSSPVFLAVEPRVEEDPDVHRAVTDVIHSLRRELPGLRALFWRDDHAAIRQSLIDGTQDIGIFLHPSCELDEALTTLTLREEEMVLVFRSPNHYEDTPEAVERVLQKRGLIVIEKEPRGLAQILNILDEAGAAPQIRFCGDRTAMILTVESGESAMIVPESTAKRLTGKDLHILHFPGEAAKLYLLCAWRKDCQNPLVSTVLERLGQN